MNNHIEINFLILIGKQAKEQIINVGFDCLSVQILDGSVARISFEFEKIGIKRSIVEIYLNEYNNNIVFSVTVDYNYLGMTCNKNIRYIDREYNIASPNFPLNFNGEIKSILEEIKTRSEINSNVEF